MKKSLMTVLTTVLAFSAYAGPKEDVQSAAAKLAEASSYTWTTTTSIEGAPFTPPAIVGKTEKGGYTLLSQEREGATTLAVLKGNKGVLKTETGWQTGEELRASAQAGGGGGGAGRGGAGMRGQLLRTTLPASEAAKLATQTPELKSADGAVVGELTSDAAKALLALGRGGRPGGGQGPEVKNAKGSVKYWLKDGALVKMQVNVSGTMAGRNGDRDMARTTTHEFKDLGTTKVEVPEEAKKKLGS